METNDITLKQAADNWLESAKPNVRNNTYYLYIHGLEKFILPKFGSESVTKITTEQLNSFFSELIKNNLATSTINNFVTIFRCIGKFVFETMNISTNLTEVKSLKRKHETSFLEKDVEIKLLKLLEENFDLVALGVLLSLRTGIKIGELCALKWKDVDWDNGKLSITKTAQRINNPDGTAYGNKNIMTTFALVKRNQNRLVPIDSVILGKLYPFQQQPDCYIMSGTLEIPNPQHLRWKLSVITQKAGLQNVTFEALRGTFARNFVNIYGTFHNKNGSPAISELKSDNYDKKSGKTENNPLVPEKLQKIKSGIDWKIERGEFDNTSSIFGYANIDGKLIIDNEAAAVVREIFQYRVSGMSLAKISDLLNEAEICTPYVYKKLNGKNSVADLKKNNKDKWTARILMRMLENIFYTGAITKNKTIVLCENGKRIVKTTEELIVVRNNHKAIVSEDDFAIASNAMTKNFQSAKGSNEIFVLSGMAHCGFCGNIMTRKSQISNKKRYTIYYCRQTKSNNCVAHSISEEQLTEAIKLSLKSYISDVIKLEKKLNEALDKSDWKLSSDISWIEKFKKYDGFKEIDKKMLLALTDDILVYDDDRVEVIFKHLAEYQEVVSYCKKLKKYAKDKSNEKCCFMQTEKRHNSSIVGDSSLQKMRKLFVTS